MGLTSSLNRSASNEHKIQFTLQQQNTEHILSEYADIDFLTFDCDEWNEEEVFKFIECCNMDDIIETKVLNRLHVWDDEQHLVDNIKLNVLQTINDNKLNGHKFRNFHHNNGTDHYRHRFHVAVLFYAQRLLLTELFITKKPQNLYINKDTMLLDSKTYVFNDIYIKDCTLTISNAGILVLKSLNNIILDNAKLDMNGKGYDNSAFELETSYTECAEYGTDIDKVFIGSRGSMGDSCSGGGRGGNGLYLECNGSVFMMNSSCISSKGSTYIHNCYYGCGDADGGCVLIKCDNLFKDKTSIINSITTCEYYYSYCTRYTTARNVVQIGSLQRLKMYVITGFMRQNVSKYVAADVCKIIDKFVENICIDDLVESMPEQIYPEPMIVDAHWNVYTVKENKQNENVNLDFTADDHIESVDIPSDGWRVRHPTEEHM